MTTKRLFIPIFAAAFASLLLWPAHAQAQRRGPGRVVVLGGGWGYPGFGLQYPWGRYGPWGPYGRIYNPYGFYEYENFSASVRIESDVKDAEVYVDGSQAGIVDDFDSWYQSLYVRPGEHEITLYAEGYRTQTHKLYFSANSSKRFRWNLEKLAAGQSSGARPKPAPPAEQPAGPTNPRAPQGVRPGAPSEPAVSDPNARFGTLSLKVMPGDAEILVDGQKWAATEATGRIAIKLSAGRHHIEVKKDGFQAYVEDVLIRPDATMSLNVGLTKR